MTAQSAKARRRKVAKPLALDWDASEEAPATPQTIAKLKSDAVRKLVGRPNGLTMSMWEAAIEIRAIREALCRGMFPYRLRTKEGSGVQG